MTESGSALAETLARDGIEVSHEGAYPIAAPASEAEVVAIVERAARDGLKVLPIGLGTKLDFCRPEAAEGACDLALSMRKLRDVVAYEPGDGTLTARAGARMGELARTVLAGGHRLTPDVPHPDEATLGGVLGASQSGPDRTRFGPVRHHVLGVRVVRSDGTIAKSGGRLVKNVTGFDLHRLYCGSRGTLCVVLEASLRLFAEPEREAALTATYPAARPALEAAEAVRALPIAPLAVTLEGVDEDFRLHVFLAGHSEQVRWEADEVERVLGDAERRDDEGARCHRALVRDLGRRNGRWPAFRMVCLPSQLPSAIDSTRDFAGARGLQPRFLAQPFAGIVDVFLPGDAATEPESFVALASELRDLLAPAEVRLDPLAVPVAVHRALARTNDEGPAARWMTRLRESFDPAGTFASPLFPCRA